MSYFDQNPIIKSVKLQTYDRDKALAFLLEVGEEALERERKTGRLDPNKSGPFEFFMALTKDPASADKFSYLEKTAVKYGLEVITLNSIDL